MTPTTLDDVERSLLRRWPESKLEPSLDRIRRVVEALGSPHRAVPVIHVTGTNGKTSTARMIDDLLRAAGLRVGRYTSPHLETVRERIVLHGHPIDAHRFADLHARLEPVVLDVDAEGIPLSFFEFVTAMAFQAFAEADLDAVVLEVGMGGRWDATNVADGRVAVVTPISLDHTEYLGPDVAAIAQEKAGIVKPGSVLVLADQPSAAAEVLLERAGTVGAGIVHADIATSVLRRVPSLDGQELDLRGRGRVHGRLVLPLLGVHQAGNAAVALAAAEAFLAADGLQLDSVTVRQALRDVRSPGRLETVWTSPRVWVDASHNPAGMAATAAALCELPSVARLVVVIAALQDKDVTGMVRALRGLATEVVVTETSSLRRMPAANLARVCADVLGSERVTVHEDLERALEHAVLQSMSTTESAVLVTGSVVTAGEARTLLTS